MPPQTLESPPFTAFLNQVRALDQSLQQLLAQYRDRLYAEAARRLQGNNAQADTGATVVVQDVEILFRQQILMSFLNFRGTSEEEFVAYLMRMVQHRAADARRPYETQMRDADREVSGDALAAGDGRGGLLADPSPTPGTHASRREEIERAFGEFIRRLNHLSARQRLSIFLGEYAPLTDNLIAQLIGRADDNPRLNEPDARSVHKARHDGYKRLEELFPDHANDPRPRE